MKFIDKKGIKRNNLFFIFFLIMASIVLVKGFEVHSSMQGHISEFLYNSSIMAGFTPNPLLSMSGVPSSQIGATNLIPFPTPLNDPTSMALLSASMPSSIVSIINPYMNSPGLVNPMPLNSSLNIASPAFLTMLPQPGVGLSGISPGNMLLQAMMPIGLAPLGMVTPGIMPPGMMPSMIISPNMIHPAMMPLNIMLYEMTPPGMLPAHMMPPNMIAPGMAPIHMMPPYMMPPGMMPPGMMPPGMMPPNSVPPFMPVAYFPVNPSPIIKNNPSSDIVNVNPPEMNENTYLNVPPDGKKRYVEGEILVVFKPDVSLSQMMSIHNRNNCVLKYICPLAGYHKVGIPNGKTMEQMIALYREENLVLFAEPNLIHYPDQLPITPNDPYYPLQWHLPSINADLAWNFGNGTGVTVAVLDTGVTQTAPDLAGTAFVPGWNFINANSDTTDYDGHGTFMTGCIAQTTNNSIGCASVAYGCTIMPVKVADDSGIFYLSAEISGLYFAINNGAQVVNMSFSCVNYSSIQAATITYAYNSGLTLVASSGNDPNAIVRYPAALEECIAVDALGTDDTIALFTTYGPWIDLCAPGDWIFQQELVYDPLTDTFQFSYAYYYGTSHSCAFVSGVAALVIGKSTVLLTPLDVRNILQNTAVDLGVPGVDVYYGYGKVDAYNALLNTP